MRMVSLGKKKIQSEWHSDEILLWNRENKEQKE